MNKYIKTVGKGILFGARHPFTEDWNLKGRHDDMSLSEKTMDSLGIWASQSVIQTTYAMAVTFGLFVALGYIGNKIEKTPVKVQMVVDEK